MLDTISLGVISLLLEILGRSPKTVEPMQLLSWQNTEIFTLPATNRDLVAEQIVQNYLQTLAQKGINPDQQGVWIQSDWIDLANHHGTIAQPAASLTKIATTLAALSTWGADYQFETKIYALGAIKDGILQGDLLIEGNQDPFFVWEEAIAVGNALQQLGIRQVTGNLIVNDKFYMNYQLSPLTSGKLLRRSLNDQLWLAETAQQYLTLPLGTPRPQIEILGEIEVTKTLPASRRLLLRHQSLPLAEILKQMNIYSNNYMAQMLADAVGGEKQVASIAAKIAGVSPQEIELINGSGLGEENRISPRAVCKMLIAIAQLLNNSSVAVADLFPVAGRDLVGTTQNRSLPFGTAVKTGTLNRVSALAGVIPTKERDFIWFAIINGGTRTEYLREQQDKLLQQLAQHWQLNAVDFTHCQQASSFHLSSNSYSGVSCPNSPKTYLGDPNRNQREFGIRN